MTAAVLILISALLLVKLTVLCSWGSESFLFPIGISYYTFSLVSYVADVYWSRDRAERNYLKLLTFTLFFPKILQGPIARHKSLAPQLLEGHRFSYENLCFGLQLMLWGYFKKTVVADRLNILVQAALGQYEQYGGFSAGIHGKSTDFRTTRI